MELGRPKIMVAVPLYAPNHLDFLTAIATLGPGYASTSGRITTVPLFIRSSLLAQTFNRLWATALVNRQAGMTHMLMVHADMAPDPGFADVMYEEMLRTGADVLSAVVPVKQETGLSSTAIGDPSDRWHERRRITLWEAHNQLPETFGIEDCVSAGLAQEGDELLLNTGLMLVDIRQPWIDQTDSDGRMNAFFTVSDELVRLPDGRIEVRCEPEDWRFSRIAARAGARLRATRKVKLTHAGNHRFPNHIAWGVEHDPGDRAAQIFGVPDPRTTIATS